MKSDAQRQAKSYREKIARLKRQEESTRNGKCYICGAVAEPIRIACAAANDSALTCCKCAGKSARRYKPVGATRAVHRCMLCGEQGHYAPCCASATAEQAAAWYGVAPEVLHMQHSDSA